MSGFCCKKKMMSGFLNNVNATQIDAVCYFSAVFGNEAHVGVNGIACPVSGHVYAHCCIGTSCAVGVENGIGLFGIDSDQ